MTYYICWLLLLLIADCDFLHMLVVVLQQAYYVSNSMFRLLTSSSSEDKVAVAPLASSPPATAIAVTVSTTPAVTVPTIPAVTVPTIPAVTVPTTPAVTVPTTPAVTVTTTPAVTVIPSASVIEGATTIVSGPVDGASSPVSNDYTTVDSTEEAIPVVGNSASAQSPAVGKAAVGMVDPAAATATVPNTNIASKHNRYTNTPSNAASSNSLKKLNYSDIVKKTAAGGITAAPPGGITATPAGKASHSVDVKKTASHSVDSKARSASRNPNPSKQTSSGDSSSSSSELPASSAPGAGGPHFSIYVNQLPPQTTVSDLHAVFGSFGTILDIDQLAGRSFAFVEFDSSAAMKSAVAAGLQDPRLALHGHVLGVQERNSVRTTVDGGNNEAGGNKPKSRRDRMHRRDRNRGQGKSEREKTDSAVEGIDGDAHNSLVVVPSAKKPQQIPASSNEPVVDSALTGGKASESTQTSNSNKYSQSGGKTSSVNSQSGGKTSSVNSQSGGKTSSVNTQSGGKTSSVNTQSGGKTSAVPKFTIQATSSTSKASSAHNTNNAAESKRK